LILIEGRPIAINDNKIPKISCKESGGYYQVATHVWSILAETKSENWQEKVPA
jgi:hypothetical protein